MISGTWELQLLYGMIIVLVAGVTAVVAVIMAYAINESKEQ